MGVGVILSRSKLGKEHAFICDKADAGVCGLMNERQRLEDDDDLLESLLHYTRF